MKAFRYERVSDTVTATRLVAQCPSAVFLGGGTNLLDQMKLGVTRPDLVVDVSRLPHRSIRESPNGGLVIGAAVRSSEMAADRRIRQRYPLLSAALLAGASGQVRNMATVAGNLLQQTRCPYFRDVSKPCNKRVPGSGCPARDGEHRDLAILGASAQCLATHPSDLAVALLALGAVVHIHRPDGDGQIELQDLYRLPGSEPHRETNLPHGTLITAVEIPPSPGSHAAFRKARARASFAFALASVAVVLNVDRRTGTVRDTCIAFGAVAPVPWRARAAEEVLRGGPVSRKHVLAAVDAELSVACPLAENAFKITLIRRLTVATLTGLADAAR